MVFGDIGTSPLYALRECFAGSHAIPVTRDNVLGVLSLIWWSLVVMVTIKYLLFVMRADFEGEGGTLALVALVRGRRSRRALVAAGLFGAALLYGDGMITPAISVLSAVEGVNVATRAFDPYVVPLTVGILVALFLFQRRGTEGVGAVFGPIMTVWFVERPDATAHPFFALAPAWGLYPLVVLATAATVIASQAIISGAFSLTEQAVKLGYAPPVEIRHTSRTRRGQIYIPTVNWILMAATIGLVLAFRTSSNLAGAYGMAVTGTMVSTTLLAWAVARDRWGWSVWRATAATAPLLAIDLAYFAANLTKIAHGGWFPLIVATAIHLAMRAWHKRRGRRSG